MQINKITRIQTKLIKFNKITMKFNYKTLKKYYS